MKLDIHASLVSNSDIHASLVSSAEKYGAPMLTIFAKRTMALSFATDTELSFAKQKKAKFSFAKTCHILIRKNMSYSHS
jgi:hypothetical protein